MAKLRISLTIPGAVALGAYEGGALAALVNAIKALGEDDIVVDTISAASAGSITGLLSAFSLLRGADALEAMTKAWVELDDLAVMFDRHAKSPLSSDALTNIANAIFGDGGVADGGAGGQRAPIQLSMTLASLAGLTYKVPGISASSQVKASTFLDWTSTELNPRHDRATYLRLSEAAIASGSNAIGFLPKSLNRGSDWQAYKDAGLVGFPADGTFWYTDGGTVDNEPLGRTIDMAQAVPTNDPRAFLLVHPDPAAYAPPGIWAGDGPQPSWARTGTRAFSISRSQDIYDDLRQVAKTNVRVRWVDDISASIANGLDQACGACGLSEAQKQTLVRAFRGVLNDRLTKLRADQDALNQDLGRKITQRSAPPPGLAELTRSLVAAASGLEDKGHVSVEVISPALSPGADQSPGQLLAGAFLFHFGGFVDQRFRQSDFTLGYNDAREWVASRLPVYLKGVDLAPALDEVDARFRSLGWQSVSAGGANLKDLTWPEKWRLVELALHVANVLREDLGGQ